MKEKPKPRQRGRNLSGRRSARNPKPQDTSSHFVYGTHAVRAAIENPNRTKAALFATPNALSRLQEHTDTGTLKIEQRSPGELDKMVGAEAVHQGLMLEVMPLPRPQLSSLNSYRLIVILDQITDPHNVGAVLRTACAFGADAVITTARHAPHETGVLAKSASGALDLVPYIEVNNLGEAIKTLKKQAVWCIGLDSEADMALGQPMGDRNIALVLGAEGKGLRHKTRQLCDQMLALDMPGPIKSLNVSNAAAIALFALSGPSEKT